MSTRPAPTTPPTTGAASQKEDRLKAVLRAGLDQTQRSAPTPKATGVFLVPTAPGAINPLPAAPGIDPMQLFKDAGIPNSQLPFLYQERRSFPRAVWNAIPKDQVDRMDSYGNMAKYEFDRLRGQEVLRSVKLQKNPWGVGGQVLGGTMTFEGTPGYEYATFWRDGDSDSYIAFEGADRNTQTIKAMELDLEAAKALSEELPPPMEDNPFLENKADIYSSAHEYARIVRGFPAARNPHVVVKFFEGLAAMEDVVLGVGETIDFTGKPGRRRADEVLDKNTVIKMDGEQGVRFHFDKGRSSQGSPFGLATVPDVVTYYPNSQPGGWVTTGEIGAVVQIGSAVYTYRRDAGRNLVLDASASTGDMTDIPTMFQFKDMEFTKQDTYPEPREFVRDKWAAGAGAAKDEAQKVYNQWAENEFIGAATAIAAIATFALCSIIPMKGIWLSARTKKLMKENADAWASVEALQTQVQSIVPSQWRSKLMKQLEKARAEARELKEATYFWRTADYYNERRRRSYACRSAAVLAGALYGGLNGW